MTNPTYTRNPETGQLTLTLDGVEYVPEDAVQGKGCRCRGCAFSPFDLDCVEVTCCPGDLSEIDRYVIWVRKS